MLAVGARESQPGEDWGGYSVDDVALKHGVGVEQETSDAGEVYARFSPPASMRYGEGRLPTD